MNWRGILGFAVGPIVGAAIGFITLPIIAWLYSVEDVGKLSMLVVGSSFCTLIFSLGLDQAYVREYHEASNKASLLISAFCPGAVTLLLALILLLAAPGALSSLLFEVDSALISAFTALFLLAMFAARFLSLVLRMQERGLAFSLSQVVPKFIFLTIVGLLALLAVEPNFFNLVVAHAASAVAVVLMLLFGSRVTVTAAISYGPERALVRSLIRYGFPLALASAAFWVLTTADKIILRSYSTFEQLGIYSVASSFAAVALVLQSIFSTVWAPIVYKWAAGDISPQKMQNVSDGMLLVVTMMFVLTGLFSWVALLILPVEYSEVQYIIVACMSYPLFYALSEVTSAGIGISRKSICAPIAPIVAGATSIGLSFWLVPALGAAGAAAATAIGFWIFLVVRTEISIKAWRTVPRFKIYGITFLCMAVSVCSVLIKGLDSILISSSWAAVGLIAIFANIIFLKDLKNSALRNYRERARDT